MIIPDITLSFDTVDVLNINFYLLNVFSINAILFRGNFLVYLYLFEAEYESSREEKEDRLMAEEIVDISEVTVVGSDKFRR